MQVQWYGQSAFRLAGRDATVFIDPFGDTSGLAARGIQFDYPPIEGVSADLLLVTHEHFDHNGVDAIGGDPMVVRARRLGTLESPVGELVWIASEHDPAAGTQRGPNMIFGFELDGLRSVISATSASRPCATSRRRRSAPSTCSSCPSAAVRRSMPGRPPRSSSASGRAGSCRCTTARRGSASSRPADAFLERMPRGAPGGGHGVRDGRPARGRRTAGGGPGGAVVSTLGVRPPDAAARTRARAVPGLTTARQGGLRWTSSSRYSGRCSS